MKKIQFVVFDYDGVFSDGKCHFDASGNIRKYYNVKDGMALGMLKKRGIKIGLISSYKTDKPILIQEQNANTHLINHLGFDFVFIGKSDKKTILAKWLQNINLTLQNVAYIGDDINDVVLQKEVGYSACPSDAVQECRDIVDYVCKNKGGDGAIREFVERILNLNETPFEQIHREVRREITHQIAHMSEADIITFAGILKESPGNIYTMGIGKSGNVAKHFADLLKSITVSAYYLDTTNALHGDIGTINAKDTIVLFSKSGSTPELIQVIPFLKERTKHLYGVCCEKDCAFEKECHKVFVTPFQEEIGGIINKIPTHSVMSHLLFINHVVSLLKREISLDVYKKNHPAGSIGNSLKKVKDVLVTEFPKIIWREGTTEFPVVDILLEMTQHSTGCCLFLNENETLKGILVDGDIRRLLLKKQDLQKITLEDIKMDCFSVSNENILVTDLDKHFKFVPLLDKDKKVIGLVKL